MISMMETDDWLRAHCRVVNDGLVWPRGMKYSWETSRKIAHTYLSLGLDPSEAVSIELVQAVVQKIEGLEQMFTALGPPTGKTSDACGSCAHVLHPGRRCGARTAETSYEDACPCMAGLTTAEANADILREGMARVRIGGAEDMDDLQLYLEGDLETARAAARRLDIRAVDTGRLSPAAFKAIHGNLPEITEEGHLRWCGRKHVALGLCDFWGGV